MKHLLAVCAGLLLLACSPKLSKLSEKDYSDDQLRRLADQAARQFIITDGHVDLPYRLTVQNFRLTREYIGIPIETDQGDFDFVRAKKGGLDAPFMSIFIPATYQVDGGAKELADSLIDLVNGIAAAHPDKFRVAFSPEEVRANFSKGIVSLPMGMENGAPIENELDRIDYFRKRGISYITLTHSKDYQICDCSYDRTRTWNGLSPFGRSVVQRMNQVGVMVDVSHISDSAFYQVMEVTTVPVIASHSSCRKFTPGLERNMNDDQLQVLAANGGVIMINFGTFFVDSEVQAYNDRKREELRALLEEKGLKQGDEAAKPIVEQFRKENPKLYADVQRVADHIDHVVAVAGIDHVGLGSDYDGVGDSLPTGLKDVSQYPNLLHELLRRGYSAEDLEKICSRNLFRVWEAVLAHATQH